MLKQKIIFLGFGLAITSSTVMADSFDDAVNLYLKGFDHCTTAKEALSAGNLQSARNALQQYETIKDRAAGINSSILSTGKRGMDSNLKFCERVAKDIEVEIGTPILERALTACEQARDQLKAGQPEQAQASFEEFVTIKDQALTTAPGLTDLFSNRSKIRRCERLEKKIAGFSRKQEALSLAIETVVEESESYNNLCQNTLQAVNDNADSTRVLQEAKNAMTTAKQHHAAVMAETPALAELETTPTRPEKVTLDKNLAAGDRCMNALRQRVNTIESARQQARQELNEYNKALDTGLKQCQAAGQQPVADVSQKSYSTARSSYEAAVEARNNVRTALAKSSYFKDHQQTAEARNINDNLSKLNRCLDTSRDHVSALFAALPLSKPTIPAVAKQQKAGKSGGVPPRKISGSIRMLDTTPEFVLVYMADGTTPEANQEIVIDSSGFDQPVYFVGNGDTFRIKSRDFSPHRITATNDLLDFSQSLSRVQSRQTRTAQVNWPANTLVQIRSDQGSVVPSHIANVASSNPKVIIFDFGAEQASFELDNPNEAPRGYLLIPGFDPLELTITEGEIKSLAITRDNEPLGSVLLKGL